MLQGGYGSSVEHYLNQTKETVSVLTLGIEDCFVEHGTVPQLQERIGLDAVSVCDKIIKAYEKI